MDFDYVVEQVGVEFDGGQHAEPEAVKYDERRPRKLKELGARVMRFRDNGALKYPQAVAEAIEREVTGRSDEGDGDGLEVQYERRWESAVRVGRGCGPCDIGGVLSGAVWSVCGGV